MSGRLGRFLLLERPRDPRGDPSPPPSPRFAGRGAALSGPGRPPAPPSSSGAQLERFAPPPEPGLALQDDAAGERPFTRCQACGMDHNRSAVECSGCGARLDTEAQRAFNDELWARRREEAAREEAAAEERRAQEQPGEDADARRSFAEALAREVGERERARLESEGLGGGSPFGPLGTSILYLVPNPVARGVAALAALVAPPALFVLAVARPGPGSVPCLLGAVALAAVFFSRRRGRS